MVNRVGNPMALALLHSFQPAYNPSAECPIAAPPAWLQSEQRHSLSFTAPKRLEVRVFIYFIISHFGLILRKMEDSLDEQVMHTSFQEDDP